MFRISGTEHHVITEDGRIFVQENSGTLNIDCEKNGQSAGWYKEGSRRNVGLNIGRGNWMRVKFYSHLPSLSGTYTCIIFNDDRIQRSVEVHIEGKCE